MADTDQAIEYIKANKDRFIEQLREMIAIPSVSTTPDHKEDVQRMAQWLVEELKRLGMSKAVIMPTPGHPVVYGESPEVPGRPTILIYGHYDVQPVDPIDEWDSPPYDGEIRGEHIYGRGASDMKGQAFAFFKALEAWRKHEDAYPVNFKFLLEGEEESGSVNLANYIDANLDLLKCDVVLNLDSGILAPDQPAIIYALRGLAYFEIEVQGPSHDLHSGMFGGGVQNPANVLCKLVAGMHDEDGRVTLPGFYDKVRPLPDEERELLAQAAYSDEELKKMSGAPALFSEKGYTPGEGVCARPALDVNGMVSGYIEEGAKTVLPAKAMVRVSMRLVPDQDETEIQGQLEEYLRQNAPDTVTWNVHCHGAGPGSVMDRKSPFMKVAQEALTQVFGKEPLFKREGGSVPVVGMIQRKLGVDSVMLGFALPDDGIHGPNEKQHLPTLFKGMETYIRLLEKL